MRQLLRLPPIACFLHPAILQCFRIQKHGKRRLCGPRYSRHCDRPDHRGSKRLQAGYDLRNAEKEERQLKVSVLQCKHKPECMFYEKYGVRICTVCLWATKKIFSAVLRMTSNSRKNLYSVNHICDFYFIIRE